MISTERDDRSGQDPFAEPKVTPAKYRFLLGIVFLSHALGLLILFILPLVVDPISTKLAGLLDDQFQAENSANIRLIILLAAFGALPLVAGFGQETLNRRWLMLVGNINSSELERTYPSGGFYWLSIPRTMNLLSEAAQNRRLGTEDDSFPGTYASWISGKSSANSANSLGLQFLYFLPAVLAYFGGYEVAGGNMSWFGFIVLTSVLLAELLFWFAYKRAGKNLTIIQENPGKSV